MKSAPKAPTPIDPTKVAGAQTTSNIDTAIAQTGLNQTGQTNPFGSTSYNQTGSTTVDGHTIPSYTQTSTLSPGLQSLLDSYLGNANAGAGSKLDFSANNPNLTQIKDPTLLAQGTTDALYNQATSRLDPTWQTNQKQLEDTLANRGITMGSEAYDHALNDFNRSKNDAYTSAQNAATQYGVQDASTLFGEGLAGHQQGVNDMLTQQNQPLSLLSQIMSSIRGAAPQSSAPQTGISPTDVTGAYSQYQNQLQNQYQDQLQAYNSQLGGIGGLLGNAMMLPFL